MIDTMLSADHLPFSAALALLAGLIVLELLLLLVGGSLMAGAEPDAPEIDAFEAEMPGKPDVPGGGLMAFFGFGKVPLLIWLAAFLAGFGLSGFALQAVAQALTGGALWPTVAVPLALGAGGLVARSYGGLLARLVPGTQTSAQSAAALSRLRGVVSQGTARAGHPAEVRVTDRHGNLQFLRAEPLDRSAEIAQGQEVLVLRLPSGPDRGAFRIVAVSD
jgi:hypothetical protein